MTLDLTGKLRPGDRKFRISTNMDLSWDRIFLAPHRDLVSVRMAEVAADGGSSLPGLPREFSPTAGGRTCWITPISTPPTPGCECPAPTPATAM